MRRKPSEIILKNKKTLEQVLEEHEHWLNQDCDNWRNMRANLSFSDLSYVNLTFSDLSYVNLTKSTLSHNESVRKGIKLTESMVGWKKCQNDVIVKLEIPKGAIVFSINNNKCRTDKAIVKEIIGANRAYSNYKYFSYYVGDVIEIYDFNCEYNVECGKGIHFFRTREEAENYD